MTISFSFKAYRSGLVPRWEMAARFIAAYLLFSFIIQEISGMARKN
jgi:hypothetical protein